MKEFMRGLALMSAIGLGLGVSCGVMILVWLAIFRVLRWMGLA